MNNLKKTTTISCPVCKFKSEVQMDPEEPLQFYFCEECGARLKPKPGDCCVYKSYGSVPCVATQKGKKNGCRDEE